MTRTARFKLLYLVTIVTAIGAGLALGLLFELPSIATLAVGLILLIPGRIQGYHYRDFFRGRRLLADGRAREAIPYFESFLHRVRARPWLKSLIWLSWGTYTQDVEVMTLNNIGAARLALGELDAAGTCFRIAVGLDPLAPLPYFNLALLSRARGDDAGADELLAKARALGYKGSFFDKAVQAAGAALARVEGSEVGRRPDV